jgi:LPXTG-motif cell wall-anchored protein
MRFFRLTAAAVVAIALLATPVQAAVRHRPAERAHRHHARHRHADAHARSQAPAVSRAGSAIIALSTPISHAANDTTVTIADFQFTPATVTIHVGDTVTWVNHGPSAHTATANNGSFNTGVLQKGQSASHTFTTAGNFTYICSIHPFMHGTIVVLANTTSTTTTPATTPTSTTPASTTPASTTPSATTTPGTTAAQSTGNTLPMTGFAVTATVLVGLLLTGAGILLRKKLHA